MGAGVVRGAQFATGLLIADLLGPGFYSTSFASIPDVILQLKSQRREVFAAAGSGGGSLTK